MIGVKDHHQESLVGQAGEVEPVYDTYSLSFFLFDKQSRELYFPQFPGATTGHPSLEQSMEDGGAPPETIDTVLNATEQAFEILGAGFGIVGFFFILLIAAVFSTLGGLIGGAVFKNEPQPPAPTTATGTLQSKRASLAGNTPIGSSGAWPRLRKRESYAPAPGCVIVTHFFLTIPGRAF